MRTTLMIAAALLLALAPAGATAGDGPAKETATKPAKKPAKKAEKPAGKPVVVMETSRGAVEIELWPAKAPQTVANFLRYVDDGFYDGTIFHRVIAGFMIQGGGFTPEYVKKETRAPVPNEADNGEKNVKYTLAMARTPDPHSATAQFFINVANNGFLNHTAKTARGWGYCVFGEVVKGKEVVDAIAGVPTGPGGPFAKDAPREKVVIEKIYRKKAK